MPCPEFKRHRDADLRQSWALGLPRHLRFDEPNLSVARTNLSSALPSTSVSGWMYAYMHALAECGMFYLQASGTNASASPSWTAQRQSQAVENIVVILEALGARGRQSPLSTYSSSPGQKNIADGRGNDSGAPVDGRVGVAGPPLLTQRAL